MSAKKDGFFFLKYRAMNSRVCSLKKIHEGILASVLLSGIAVAAPPDSRVQIRLRSHTLDTALSSSYGSLMTEDALPLARAVEHRESTAGTLPYIVQFSDSIHATWKEAVVEAGGMVHGYMPDNALLVEMAEASVPTVGMIPTVRWIGAYRPEYKVQPTLALVQSRTRAEVDTLEEEPPIHITIQTLSPAYVDEVADWIRQAGGEVFAVKQARRMGLIEARVHSDLIEDLSQQASVRWIEEYVESELHNDFAVLDHHMNVEKVWSMHGLSGANQIVGHADTGLDIGTTNGMHPDFAGRVLSAYAWGRPGDWSDPHAHGTHTAGSILGDGSASSGQFRGVAYAARLVHQSLLDSGGGLGGLPLDLNDLYLQAYADGARIHSDSWGAAVYGDYTSDAQESDEFMWDHKDMLLIFSAGNSGKDSNSDGVVDPDSIGSPGTAKNLLTVGAAENDRLPGSGGYSSYFWYSAWPSSFPRNPIRTDYISSSDDGEHQGMAAFSGRGPTDDGRIKPDLVGPGTDVISCRSQDSSAGTGWGAHANSYYAFSGGTSMSTPLMAGAAALVREFYMTQGGITNPSAALIKGTLINGARSLSPGQYGTGADREIPALPRPNYVEGWGQPDLENTLFPAAPSTLSARDDGSLSTSQIDTFQIYVYATDKLSVTLAYTDYPGDPAAAVALVNDLDLLLTGPAGTTYYPNGLESPDRLNNVEGIEISSPTSGLYGITVSGFNVPYGPQPYALIISGGLSDSPAPAPISEFKATPSAPTKIDLQWIKNSSNDNVLIAYSTNNIFGLISHGTVYSEEDMIGAATVLYNGSETNYSHTNLYEGTTYYYVAWSVNGDPEYSSGIAVNAALPMPPATLPFYEPFATRSFSASNWALVDDATIDTVGIGEPSAPYSARLNGNPDGADEIRTVPFNLSSETALVLSYWYEQTGGGESADIGDNLIVEFLNAGESWIELERQLGVGADMSIYAESTIVLPPAALHEQVRFRFRSVGSTGPYDDWFVDDIRIYEEVPELDHFTWSVNPDPHVAGVPFAVEITARDQSKAVFNSFTETVALSGRANGTGLPEIAIGAGAGGWKYPMATYYHDARTQVIYLNSEVGASCTITSLLLNVMTVPGQVMNNWTIRMRHTPRGNYIESPIWESDWIIVHQSAVAIFSPGWVEFIFDTPFEYNGTDHLMVDFSHNNSSYTSDGFCEATQTEEKRSLSYQTDSNYGDPLTWSGTSIPTPTALSYIPNIILVRDTRKSISISPSVSGHFAGGVWSGTVTIPDAETNVTLLADDASKHMGISAVFDVHPPDADADGIPDAWEKGYFGHPSNCVWNIDWDLDGHNNWQEYICGMDPTNAASYFMITNWVPLPGSAYFVIEWNSVSSRVYSTYWSTNLMESFHPLEFDIEYPRNSSTDTIHSAEDQCFYRVEVQLK
jgi:subtilisin family serine protease